MLERCAYTTSVLLTHYFRRGGDAEVAPDLRMRIYHDARVAEVLPDSRLDGFRRQRPGPETGSLAWRRRSTGSSTAGCVIASVRGTASCPCSASRWRAGPRRGVGACRGGDAADLQGPLRGGWSMAFLACAGRRW
ncbi:MAG: DUF1249 domain-containing protein [Arhodomonas sp.]|nr:DUF1249 domain-containing protein [Arhodomonas sp.]